MKHFNSNQTQQSLPLKMKKQVSVSAASVNNDRRRISQKVLNLSEKAGGSFELSTEKRSKQRLGLAKQSRSLRDALSESGKKASAPATLALKIDN